jgi:uncharacterized membrane protein HdeD (DUF308 family)
MSAERDQFLYNSLIYLLFGLLSILYGRKILKNPSGETPILFWIAIKLSAITKGKQGETQKKNELLNPERVRKNAIGYLIVGVLLSSAGILGLVSLFMASQ